jgi:hypothetical protein
MDEAISDVLQIATALLGFELDRSTDDPNKKANQPKWLIYLF